MMLIAAGWISILLLVGGLALDHTLTGLMTRNFDEQLGYMLTGMIGSAEIGPDGEVFFIRPLGDQRFMEPNSGLYWQIRGKGHEDYPSRSLWDRSLDVPEDHFDAQPHVYDSDQFAGEPLRVMERSIILPGSNTKWMFTVAASRQDLDDQIKMIRSILIYSFVALGVGLLLMAGLQTWYGLFPLRHVRRAIQKLRATGAARVTDPLPREVEPLVDELNALLAHTERQAEEARTHAGNLAHALKTPLTVLMNAATARAPDLSDTVIREAAVMRRQVDHHLARARAVGRRAAGMSRAEVWPSLEAVLRAVGRLHEETRFDLDGNHHATVAIEKQDLEEVLGNLIENAAKYGGGSVFVTVDAGPKSDARCCEIWIEDDGMGIPQAERVRIFDRGARLDTGKPGTGLGLAIVRDVVEIYGGTVELDESEDLGGLLVKLKLPRAVG
ncbi:sensor histidine kinase [Novosphingobium mangrovi (ex Huang et al. 2023)]|uniref:histidine kinase n=1 Tax=Novosphingobium mangrovi (ex Huang et al. 2023) TaxID=2976432 RepID=A0ABT2I6F0_9SPHN|nr:HAMP domain-containing sensor histidine kinase [Novosphingobium mangrovi (ex Huang et al. 2023)]MCT2400396.1 HAMP domain-containing histidine kinase [Novosphingobium mangrovi (ex Huang et al. 2023)]